MALPPGITPKTVTVGIASFFDGSLAEGTATITAPVNVVHTPTNRPIFSSQMSHRFVDGETSFNLAPTDAPGLNRVDWTYKLNVVISGALVQPEPVYFILPAAGPDTIDLDSLVTVPSSAGVPISATVVTSVNGQVGDVTVEGGGGTPADGSITPAKLSFDPATQAELDTLSSSTTTGLANKVNTSTYTAGLAAKANTADLAAVAQSGSYNDLANKPTIPSVAGLAPYRAGLFTPPTAPVKVVSTMDSGWTHLDQGAAVHDTTIFETGAGSLKITASPAGAGEKAVAWLPFTAQDWSRDAFALYFRTDAWPNIVDSYLMPSTSGMLAQFFRVQLNPKLARVVNDEFSQITLTRGDFENATGGANWSTVNGLAFQLYSAAGTTPSFWIDQFVRYPTSNQPTISFANDDGFATSFTVMKPAHDKHGHRASYYVMPPAVGTNGYMGQAQIDALAAAGNEIGGHGVTDLTALSFAAAEADIEATKKYLVDRGYKGGDVYAYPLGGQNAALRAMVAKYFGAARGTSTTGQTRSYLNRRNLTTRQLGTGITLATAQGWVDRAIANNEWLIITSHALRTPTLTAEDWTPADYAALVDYVASKGVQVLPVAEALAEADLAPVLVSPNGTQFRVSIGNDGALTTSAA